MNRLALLAFTIALALAAGAVGQDRADQRSNEQSESLPLATLGPIEPVPDLPVQLITQSPALPPIAPPNPPMAADSPSPLETSDVWTSGGRSPSVFWARGEVGLWWLQGSRLPPLLTASPAGTAQSAAGVLGNPGTTVLFGNNQVNDDMRVGGQFTFCAWLDSCQNLGLEAGFLAIGGANNTYVASSDGSRIVARPFTDAATGAAAAQLVSFPGLVRGSSVVNSTSDPLYGANLLARHALCYDCTRRFDFLFGYRMLQFNENLQIQENLTSLDAATSGTNIVVTDRFHTQNTFHGGELGLQAEFWRGPFSLQILGKVAIGNLQRIVTIDGSTVVTVPGFSPLVGQGGLLALPTNSGTYVSNTLAWVPEIGVNAGWQFAPNWRATIGYSLFWWTDLVRPGDQIDRTVNPNRLPPAVAGGPNRPEYTLRDSDLLAQGIRFGIEFRY